MTAIVTGCVEPYFPEVATEVESILVVEGLLNSSNNSAKVKLSRATTLYSEETSPIEENAQVFIEEETGNTYALSKPNDGTFYEGNGIPIDHKKKYRLYIKTTDGKEYRSDYIQPKPAPTLDSVVWRPSQDGVTIAVNSHDPAAATHYYQWSYTETWGYTSAYYSSYKMVNGAVTPRKPEEMVYYCWKTRESNQILITTTTNLAEDRVHEFPVAFLPKGDQRLTRAYSIMVRQRTLDEKTYTYLKQLEKNTENLGGLFDPLPWQAEGNVHNIEDSNEPVMGYFNATSVTEQRLTFTFYDLPAYLYAPIQTGCGLEIILAKDLAKYGDSTPIIAEVGTPPIGFSTSSIGCIDCRILGGTLTKPDYMP